MTDLHSGSGSLEVIKFFNCSFIILIIGFHMFMQSKQKTHSKSCTFLTQCFSNLLLIYPLWLCCTGLCMINKCDSWGKRCLWLQCISTVNLLKAECFFYLYMANNFFHQPFLSKIMAKAERSSPATVSQCLQQQHHSACVVLLWLTQFTVIRLKPRGFCSPSACLAGPAL